MLFSSIPFLYYFLPCALILCLLVPRRFRNFTLLLSSLVFYAWGEPKYVLLMAASVMVGYIFGLLVEKSESTRRKKCFLSIAVTICVGFLAYFKYANFFITNFNAVTGLSLPLLKIALPIGISFYTFQIISYVVDVYRGETKAQRNIISFAAYVTMFPQLIAGPIVRYTDIASQLETRKTNFENIALGARRFVLGLAKKILIANSLGELCEIFRLSGEKTVAFYWLYAVAFTLHVYFDFSGYSDMAIGIGKILGFDFMENFNYPFISRSITEFWRRWHMSLGSWFRDYVYIPLGGNRVSKKRWFFNIFITWMLTGFWHGAAWNFIVWGLFFAVLLILEKLWLLKHIQKQRVLNHIYVIFFVLISFVIFNAEDMAEAVSYIKGMFGAGGIAFISDECIYYLRSYGVTIIVAMLGSTPVIKNLIKSLYKRKRGEKALNLFEPIVLVLLMIVITAYLVDGSFNPFLYFRF